MRLRPLAAVLIACGAASLAACGGTATVGIVGLFDAGRDAAESPGCTPETCSSSDDGGPAPFDATLDSAGPSPGEDANAGGDDSGGDEGGGPADSTAPVDSPSGDEDASDGSHGGGDSGGDKDSGSDSGGDKDSGSDAGGDKDSGSDAGGHIGDAGSDSGDHASDAGSDSGGHSADAGRDAGPVTIPDGGLPPTPGEVSCGSDPTCDLSTSQCCLLTDGGGDCIASSASCPSGTATVTCNEASDCPGNDLCCVTIDIDTASATAACQAGPCGTPAAGGAQACRTDQECGAGGSCVLQSCDGVSLELCGLADFFGLVQCTAE